MTFFRIVRRMAKRRQSGFSILFIACSLLLLSCVNRHAPLLAPPELRSVETFSFGRDTITERPRSFSVAAWNIHYGKRFPEILRALATTLRSDIYLLQEVDRFTNRSRDRETGEYRDIPRLLAQELEMNSAYGIEFQELKQDSPSRAAFTGQQTLSVFPLPANQAAPFENQLADWSKGLLSLFQKRHGGRMFLYSRVQIGELGVHLYNAHLESRASDDSKTLQILEILHHIKLNLREDEPVIVAGDLNTRKGEDSPVVKALLAQGFVDPFPEPENGKIVTNHKDDRRLDWIFSRNLEPVEAYVSSEFLGSNHRALRVVFQLPLKTAARFDTGF